MADDDSKEGLFRIPLAKSISVPARARSSSPANKNRINVTAAERGRNLHRSTSTAQSGHSVLHSFRSLAGQSFEEVAKSEDNSTWYPKRLKLISRKYGLKGEQAKQECIKAEDILPEPQISTPGIERVPGTTNLEMSHASSVDDACIRSIRARPPLERKDSAFSIVKHFIRSGTIQESSRRLRTLKASFDPRQVEQDSLQEVIEGSTPTSAELIPPSGSEEPSSSRQEKEAGSSSSFSPDTYIEMIDMSTKPLARPTQLFMPGDGPPQRDETTEFHFPPLSSTSRPLTQRPRLAKHLSTPLDDDVFFAKIGTPLFSGPQQPMVSILDTLPEEDQAAPVATENEEALRGLHWTQVDVGPLEDQELGDLTESRTGDVRRVASRSRTSHFLPSSLSRYYNPQTRFPRYGSRVPLELGDSHISRAERVLLTPSYPEQPVGEPMRMPVDSSHRQRMSRFERTFSVDDQRAFAVSNTILDNVYTQVLEQKQHRIRAKRRRGEGYFGKLFCREMKSSAELPAVVVQALRNAADERPFFTYWVSSCQVILCILSILFYGVSPWHASTVYQEEKEVWDVTMTYIKVSMMEPTNFWLGPRHSDLIRLGATYAPCMRRERKVMQLIEEERKAENMTGCCIYADGSGCFQTSRSFCPSFIASFHSWRDPHSAHWRFGRDLDAFNKEYKGERTVVAEAVRSGNGRTAGPVCGQDPILCETPSSVEPHAWDDDLTKWPICSRVRQGAEFTYPEHMTCKLTGRPCCIQTQGQCRIASRQYCDAVHGVFHENATLCSQVDCLESVCGMITFISKDSPDQFSRLFISLFIHAGLFHLVISLAFQFLFMRDLELMIGWWRMAIIYLGSGIAGNLASAIFAPFVPSAGPSGSNAGIQGALFAEVILCWGLIVKPWLAVLVHIGVFFLMICLGLLPHVNNWTIVFGFMSAALFSVVLIPRTSFYDRQRNEKEYKRERLCHFAIRAGCSVLIVVLYSLLMYLFFNNVQIDCPACDAFNCLKFLNFGESSGIEGEHFCDNQGLRLKSMLPI